MISNNIPKFKNIYIFGNKHVGFLGHTYSKTDAKEIMENRKHLKMFKIKNDDYCKQHLSINTEFVKIFDKVFMTANEEEFFIESFIQYQSDVIYYIDILFNNIKYFKFDNKEKHIIDNLLSFLEGYKNYINEGQYLDEDGEIYDAMFDTESAQKWFIENILDK